MKAALLAAVAASFCWVALSAVPAGAAVCMSDYAFKAAMVRVVDSGDFLGTVEAAQSLEKIRSFDLLHREYVSQKAEPLPASPAPCTQSAEFRDAVVRAGLVRQSLRRVATVIAAFPSTRAASRAQWRPVLVSAATGAAAALRLASDVGDAKIKLSQLAAQLAALRLQLKG